jgi:hypothetical protein
MSIATRASIFLVIAAQIAAVCDVRAEENLFEEKVFRVGK